MSFLPSASRVVVLAGLSFEIPVEDGEFWVRAASQVRNRVITARTTSAALVRGIRRNGKRFAIAMRDLLDHEVRCLTGSLGLRASSIAPSRAAHNGGETKK